MNIYLFLAEFCLIFVVFIVSRGQAILCHVCNAGTPYLKTKVRWDCRGAPYKVQNCPQDQPHCYTVHTELFPVKTLQSERYGEKKAKVTYDARHNEQGSNGEPQAPDQEKWDNLFSDRRRKRAETRVSIADTFAFNPNEHPLKYGDDSIAIASRSCGNVKNSPDHDGELGCVTVFSTSGVGDTYTTMCYCDKDLCNNGINVAPCKTPSYWTLIVSLAVVVLLRAL